MEGQFQVLSSPLSSTCSTDDVHNNSCISDSQGSDTQVSDSSGTDSNTSDVDVPVLLSDELPEVAPKYSKRKQLKLWE